MARILLVDDEAATRDLVRRALETQGHGMVVTEDGASALARLQEDQGFDLLITDVQMPGMDGISLLEKAVQAAPGLRVILMSGYADQLARADGLSAKVLRTLTKPFTLEQIRAEVAAALAD